MVEVSVIIPCYNGELYVDQAVNSVLRQPGVDLEVIVVDDGSTDDSFEIIEKLARADPRIRLIRQSNRGLSSARNAGVRLISPESRFAFFLDADDVLTSNALQPLLRRLRDDPTIVAAAGTVSRIDEHGVCLSAAPDRLNVHYVKVDGAVSNYDSAGTIGYWHVLPINPISVGSVLIRRAALPLGDVFDEGLRACEDWDLWLRLTQAGDVGLVTDEVLQYRLHSANMSKQYRLMQLHRAAVYDKQWAVVSDDERERLRAAYRFGMYRFDAQLCGRWARERLVARHPVEAMRAGIRSLRYQARYLVAVVRGEPDLGPVVSIRDGS